MSWLVARIYNRFMAESEQACLSSWRAQLLGELSGEVLEVGAGTGSNLEHYPADVARLVLSEPDPHMRRQLSNRIAERGRSGVVLSEGSLEELPLPDASFDAVVATLVLCSVPNPARALSEIHRVLKPGGSFAFLEHVAAENNPGRLVWQRRVEPFWRLVAGNCHTTRRTADHITQAGFELEWIERESVRKALPWVRPSIRGIARRPLGSADAA
jgi:ubiquinone/menaquinone biosynthesis C-methylase UbiE